MSMKETIHQWIDSFPDDHPGLRGLFEEARLGLALNEAEADVAAGRTTPIEEVISRFEEKCRLRPSA